MIKYVFVRLILILVNIFVLGTILFFALNFANFTKWTHMSFKEYSNVTWRLYKLYVEHRIINFDWGITEQGDQVLEAVVPRFWVTLKYNVIALLVYLPLGFILGIISAYKKNGIFDRFVNTITLVFGSIPTYILTFLLIVLLGYRLAIFPPFYGAIKPGFWGSIVGLGIPIIALSAAGVSKISRVVRDEMSDALDSKFVLLLHAKGLTKLKIFLRHLLRHSIVGVLPVMIDVFMFILMGSFFVEMVFGIDGVAQLLYNGLIRVFGEIKYILIDVNTTIVICTFYMVLVAVFSLIVDITYFLIDPRIRINK